MELKHANPKRENVVLSNLNPMEFFFENFEKLYLEMNTTHFNSNVRT